MEPVLLTVGAATVIAALRKVQDRREELSQWVQQQWQGAAGAVHRQEQLAGRAAAAVAAAARRAAAGGRLSLSEDDMFYFQLASSHVFD